MHITLGNRSPMLSAGLMAVDGEIFGPLSTAEVFSTELAATGPAAMAATVHDACRAVLPR